MMTAEKLTPPQARLYDAIRRGARLSYQGWQEIAVDFGARHPDNFRARQQTLYALRDRGLVELGSFGVRLIEGA